MESTTIGGMRSRSRSKTPFLRSNCDGEHCTEDEEHVHNETKSDQKTSKRSTPVKQFSHPTGKITTETIRETVEDYLSPPVHRTRQFTRSTLDKLGKTSDYSSEESLDRAKTHRKEIFQNQINSQYEQRVSTSSQRYSTLSDVTLSPIFTTHHVTDSRRSSRIGSPTYSACSTDSSFAEQALADTSALLDKDPSGQHLPSRLYKMAGEYWNKYPKTDYTYSPLSKDRVELAPGQVAMPNMSRRSLSQFRIQGPNTAVDEVDRQSTTSEWTTTNLRKRYTSIESSDDEGDYIGSRASIPRDQRWWITRLIVTVLTTITTSCGDAYRSLVGPSHRYPYTDRRPPQASLISRASLAAVSPFYWIYTVIKNTVTTTITTVTESISPNHVSESEKYISRSYKGKTVAKRSWWPWLLLLLLPVFGYGCYNYSEEIMPRERLVVDTYKPSKIVQDPDLSKRVAALEGWAIGVDNRLKYIDRKLSKHDNIETQIEQYSLKYLQQNLVQILSGGNTEAIALKLKTYFDNYYVTGEQLQAMSQEIHERLINTWKPELDEDRIRRLVQDYLAVFERRQLELIVEKVREYVKEVQVHGAVPGFDPEAVRELVTGMLDVYDADKTGLVDYALESAGGQVISTKCTELYQIKTKQYSILGLPVWWVYTSPRYALTPGAMPAECWAFQDSQDIWGLHGEQDPEPHLFGDYVYDANGTAIQYFPVRHPKVTNIGGVDYPVAYDIIELRVESNHGNPTYTCVYRFRVHGNALNDIRRATEDSIKDSET